MAKTLDEMLWAIRDDRKLSKNAKLVWVMLLSRGEDCRPALKTIAADCHLARSTVFLAIQELESAGWLKVSPNQTKVTPEQKYGVPETSSYYVICPGYEGVVRQSDYPPAETPRPEGGSPVTGLGDSPVVGRGSPVVGPKDNQNPTSVVSTSVGTAKRGAQNGARIPGDFLEKLWADKAQRAWVVDRCPDLTLEEVRIESERMFGHFDSLSGQRATKRNWMQAWRNWMLKEQLTAARRNALIQSRSGPPSLPGDDGWVQPVTTFRDLT